MKSFILDEGTSDRLIRISVLVGNYSLLES